MPRTSKKKPLTQKEKFMASVKKPFISAQTRTKAFMARRPHRSFRRTRRRDYVRSLDLPSYFGFTKFVTKTLWQYKKTFVWLAIIYAFLTVILVGIGSQDLYSTLSSTLQDTGSEIFQGNVGQIGQAALLFVSIGSSGLTNTPTDQYQALLQHVYVVLIGLMVWLTTVWLLRNLLAGHKVKMRDGLYNACAPIISTALVTIVLIVQLIPIGIAVIAFASASSTGLLDSGVAAMLFWFAAALLVVLSLYWITSTFFALIIVTLPGMYPMRALKTAGDLLVGRRLRILLRILWMMITIVVVGALVLIPTILIDIWLTHIWSVIDSVPVVPVALMLFSVVAFIWAVSYIYLLYRRVVDDDAKPAL